MALSLINSTKHRLLGHSSGISGLLLIQPLAKAYLKHLIFKGEMIRHTSTQSFIYLSYNISLCKCKYILETRDLDVLWKPQQKLLHCDVLL